MRLDRLMRRAQRRRGLPTLEDAIFGNRFLRFLIRRTGFPLGRALIASFLHALEAAAMAMLFDPEMLTPLVSARLLIAVGSGTLWAGTEGVRRDVRSHLEAHRPRDARSRLRRAMLFSWAGSVCAVSAGVVYVSARPHVEGYFTVVDAYYLAAACRIGLAIPVRVMQAGVHAMRRVYRPLWSFLVPDVLDGLSIFILWRALGPWSVPVGMLLVAALKLAIAAFFTRRSLRQLSLVGEEKAQPSAPAESARERGRWAWWIAGAAMTAPVWMILGLWDDFAGQDGIATVAWVLYLLRPLAALLPRLAGIFYVDLVRARRLGALAERRLLRRIARSLGAVGAVLGAVAAVGSDSFPLAFGLFLLFAIQGVFSLQVVRLIAFAKAYISLLPALVACVPLALLNFDVPPAVVVLVSAAAFGLATLLLPGFAPPPAPELAAVNGEPLALYTWLAQKGSAPTTLLECEQAHRVARHLAQTGAALTRVGRKHILVFGHSNVAWPERTAGLALRVVGTAATTAIEGVRELAPRAGVLTHTAESFEHDILPLPAICERIALLCPEAKVIADTGRADVAARELVHAAREKAFGRHRHGHAAGLWAGGRLIALVYWPAHTAGEMVAEVRALLHQQSVARLRLKGA